MREAGFDRSCLLVQASTIPYIGTPQSIFLSRAWKDEVAEVSHKDAIEEADLAVKDLGYRANQIVRTSRGVRIEHPGPLLRMRERHHRSIA